jgi:hypothetical protein
MGLKSQAELAAAPQLAQASLGRRAANRISWID